MKHRQLRIMVMIIAVMMVIGCVGLVRPQYSYADYAELKGDVNASDLNKGDTYHLTGDATITLSEGDDVTINGIYIGDHTLTIEGSDNGILRIIENGAGGSPVDIGGSSGSLDVRGGHLIIIDDTDSKGYPSAVGSGGGFKMEDGVVDIIQTNNACVMLFGINLNWFDMTGGILNIDVSSSSAYAYGICANNVNISNGTLNINAYTSANNADAKALSTASLVNGCWEMTGGSLSLNGCSETGKGYGIWTSFSDSTVGIPFAVKGGIITANGSYRGIYISRCHDVGFYQTANITATGKSDSGFYAASGVSLTISGSVTFNAWTENPGCRGAFYSYSSPSIESGLYIRTPRKGYWNSGSGSFSGAIVASDGSFADHVCIEPDLSIPAKNLYVDGMNGGYFADDLLFWNIQNGYIMVANPDIPVWNAWYDPDTGTLTLRDYDGDDIGISRSGVNDKKLTIVLEGTSKINISQFGIYADGCDLEITSSTGGRLEITGCDSSTTGGGAGAIVTQWSSSRNKSITISGNAEVYINVSAKQDISGLRAGSDIIIRDHASADINVAFGDDPTGQNNGVMTYGNFIITTDRFVNVSMNARDYWDPDNYYYGYALCLYNWDLPQISNAEYVSFSVSGGNKRYLSYSTQADIIGSMLESGSYMGYSGFRKTTRDTDAIFLKSYDNYGGAFPVTGAFFPDIALRGFISDYYDADGDGWLSNSEQSNATTIVHTNDYPDYYSLAGIEYLGSLNKITVIENYIRTLDLSENSQVADACLRDNLIDQTVFAETSKLANLDLTYNKLNSLDLEGLSELQTLQCGENPYLLSLDLSPCPELKLIDCSFCDLGSLDLSPCPELILVNCDENVQIDTLDVSSLPKLYALSCNGNVITELDLSHNPELVYLDCGGNEYITELDVSSNKKLQYLYCHFNRISSLTLGMLPELKELCCYENDLSIIDISRCPLILDVFSSTVAENLTYPKCKQWKKEVSDPLGGYTELLRADPSSGYYTYPSVYASFNGASLSLKDKICINIYFIIPDYSDGWQAKVYYEKDGFETVKYTYDLINSASYYSSSGNEYKIQYTDISAKEMTERVRVKIFDGNGDQVMINDHGRYVGHIDYRAADWANTMIADSSRPEKTVKLAKALLNYGGEAQNYWSYKPENNANAGGYLASEMAAVTADDLAAYAPVKDANASVVGENGISLSLKSETYLNVYFTNNVTVSASNLNGAKLAKVKNGSEWVAKFTGITAKNLGNQYTLTVKYDGKTSVQKYSALSWAYNILKGTSETAKPLAKALYLYQQAAVEYFKK